MITGFKKWISHILFDKKTKITYTPELLESISIQLQLVNNQSPDPQMPLKQATFVVFDTETTGFYPYAGDELISIGAVMIRNGAIEETHTFHEWINPYRSIPPEVQSLTGVLEKDVIHAPPALVVIHQFLQFIGPQYLVAHCADFDLNFINTQLKKYCKKKLSNPVIDTMMLSYHLNAADKFHNLDHLLSKYEITIHERHHALEDAKMTASLFLKFLDQLEQRGITTIRGLDSYVKSMHLLHQSHSF